MAKRVTWRSDGDVWVFEEGEHAKVTRRGASRQESVSFRVLEVISGTLVMTDLRGVSRDGWVGPRLEWSGDYVLEP